MNGRHGVSRAIDPRLATLARTFAPGRADGSTAMFSIAWHGRPSKHRRSQLTDEEFAEYERDRLTAMRYTGQHFRHFDRPFDRWTAGDVDTLVGDMVATLAECPKRPLWCDRRWWIHVHRLTGSAAKHHGVSILIGGGEREFRATADLRRAPVPVAAVVGWCADLSTRRFFVTERAKGVGVMVEEEVPADWRGCRAEQRRRGRRLVTVGTADSGSLTVRKAEDLLTRYADLSETDRCRLDAVLEGLSRGDAGARALSA